LKNRRSAKTGRERRGTPALSLFLAAKMFFYSERPNTPSAPLYQKAFFKQDF
jgi:hypothetical protein